MGEAKTRGTKQERDALAIEIASLVSGESYRFQMIEVKRRFRAASHILRAEAPVSGDIHIDNECAFAQVRQIVELIAFSGLIADRLHYQALRIEEAKNDKSGRDKGDYTADWNAPQILDRLRKINPDFLPQSVGDWVPGPDHTKHVPFGVIGPKTQADLIDVFNVSNRYLHASRPFVSGRDARIELKRAEARSILDRQLELLRGIIWRHRKFGLLPQHPSVAGRKFVWIVDLLDPQTDEVDIVTAVQDLSL